MSHAIRERRRVRAPYHLPGVGGVRHPQAHAEARVGLDLVGDHARGLLGGQHQVDAERAAYARRGDQAVHELGLLGLELGELVGHDEEVRHGLGELAGGEVPLVGGDVHRGVSGRALGPGEQGLPAHELGPERRQRARHLRPVEVGDRARQVRQAQALAGEGVGEAAM